MFAGVVSAGDVGQRGVQVLLCRREGWSQDDIPFLMWDRMAGVMRGEESALDLARGIRIE